MLDDFKASLQKELTRLLEAGVVGNVFPGAVASMSWRRGEAVERVDAFAGRLEEKGSRVQVSTPYDLASLTKPFVATAILRVIAAGKGSLQSTVGSFVSDLRSTPVGDVSIDWLLSHRAGLSPWGGLYLDVPYDSGTSAARRWMVQEAARRVEDGPTPGTARYSDLGYIVAGELLAKMASMPLDRALATHVTQPLGIADDVFFAGSLPRDKQGLFSRAVAPTELCEWRGYLLRGEVHDENAGALGGIAGHAGLFGTASAVTRFGMTFLDAYLGMNSFLPQALVQDALAPRANGSYRVGWDSKSAEASTAGKRLSARSFGHLGFTGTSIWCDPDRQLVVTLLSNRVNPTRANEKIKGFRPVFHDSIVHTFDKSDIG